jgi:hypothetical protein
MATTSVSWPRKPSQRRGNTPPPHHQAREMQRQELFAVVAIASALSQVVDEEFVPAIELIARIVDGVATFLEDQS